MRVLPQSPHAPQVQAAPTPATGPLLVPATWPGQAVLDTPETAHVLQAVWRGDAAVVVPSPPGAGKTRLVTLLAAALAHRADLRIGIAAQTRDQSREIARRLGALSNRTRLLWSGQDRHPPKIDGVQTVSGNGGHFPGDHGGIVIATTARWMYTEPDSMSCDVMIVDEAWQATYADLGALGAFSRQVVCVGDPGQIAPVVTGSTRRWEHSPTGPHLPAPIGLQNAHGDLIETVSLPHTWRLGPLTTSLVQPAFYPDLPFTSRRPPEHLTDDAGSPVPEVAHRIVTVNGGQGDPALTHACADRAQALVGAVLTTPDGTRELTAADVGVVTPHVNQASAVRALLADHPGMLIGTANQLQGLERSAVVALHPFAGYRDLSPFAADTGRACVMLSRHRAHLSVILDAATHHLLTRNTSDAPGLTTHRHLLGSLLTTPGT